MRLIVGISCLLLGVGMLSCRMDPDSKSSQARATMGPPTIEWVRTAQGWERAGRWDAPERRPPPLHPLVIAAGQALVSILGLAVCERGR